MQYRALGGTHLNISELGVGFSFVAEQGQQVISECVALALDEGINYFDTAPYYSGGEDEAMLGHALSGKRNRVVLATKVGYTADPNDHRSASGLMRQLEGSLARLRTDHVDIIQIHEADFRKWWVDEPVTPFEGMNPTGALIDDVGTYDFGAAPVIEFLSRARETGKVRFIGLTAKNARLTARLVDAIAIDSLMLAHQFNPILRNGPAFLFEATAQKNIGVVIGAPLMRSWLARARHSWRTSPPAWMDRVFLEAYLRYIDLNASSDMSLAEMSIRWMLGEPRQHALVFGFRSMSDIVDNVRAASRGPLDPGLQAQIDAVGIVHPLIFQGRTTL